ncbi:hypothetical protein RIF29_28486 [Crotalaria pallida]|uniref:Uncharacterized protein n=1 Tax=Crotalaria pallida TaxID=3830 RepID=A0AAN9HVE3_CROPI
MCRKGVKQQWVQKNKPTQKDIDEVVSAVQTKEAIANGTIPHENIDHAREEAEKVLEAAIDKDKERNTGSDKGTDQAEISAGSQNVSSLYEAQGIKTAS